MYKKISLLLISLLCLTAPSVQAVEMKELLEKARATGHANGTIDDEMVDIMRKMFPIKGGMEVDIRFKGTEKSCEIYDISFDMNILIRPGVTQPLRQVVKTPVCPHGKVPQGIVPSPMTHLINQSIQQIKGR